MSAAWFLVPGFLFGLGLAISGMTDPAKVQGFLDVAGDWDASLMFVLGGAVVSFGVLHRVVTQRARPLDGGSFPGRPSGSVDRRLLAGAALFGVGWGLLGFCPGPALANLATGRTEPLWFVPAMLVGMLVAQRAFGADRC